MSVKDAVVNRIQNICQERKICINALANRSGITASTLYSLLDSRRRDVSLITVKKIFDGLDMPLEVFFASAEFQLLEQEIV